MLDKANSKAEYVQLIQGKLAAVQNRTGQNQHQIQQMLGNPNQAAIMQQNALFSSFNSQQQALVQQMNPSQRATFGNLLLSQPQTAMVL